MVPEGDMWLEKNETFFEKRGGHPRNSPECVAEMDFFSAVISVFFPRFQTGFARNGTINSPNSFSIVNDSTPYTCLRQAGVRTPCGFPCAATLP